MVPLLGLPEVTLVARVTRWPQSSGCLPGAGGSHKLHFHVWWWMRTVDRPFSPHGLSVLRRQVQKLQGLQRPFSESIWNHLHYSPLVKAYHEARSKSRNGKQTFCWKGLQRIEARFNPPNFYTYTRGQVLMGFYLVIWASIRIPKEFKYSPEQVKGTLRREYSSLVH